jgi:hypothetical protein
MDQEKITEAIQSGLVDPIKSRFSKIESRQRLILLLLVLNALLTFTVLIHTLK